MFLNQTEYVQTWYRAAPYVYGLLGGRPRAQIVCSQRGEARMGAVFCYLFGTGFCVSSINLVWLLHKESTNDVLVTFCHGWVFSCWGLGLLLLTLPWACGHGGLLPNKILSHNFFAILSKLTFAAYLIHPVVMSVMLLPWAPSRCSRS